MHITATMFAECLPWIRVRNHERLAWPTLTTLDFDPNKMMGLPIYQNGHTDMVPWAQTAPFPLIYSSLGSFHPFFYSCFFPPENHLISCSFSILQWTSRSYGNTRENVEDRLGKSKPINHGGSCCSLSCPWLLSDCWTISHHLPKCTSCPILLPTGLCLLCFHEMHQDSSEHEADFTAYPFPYHLCHLYLSTRVEAQEWEKQTNKVWCKQSFKSTVNHLFFSFIEIWLANKIIRYTWRTFWWFDTHIQHESHIFPSVITTEGLGYSKSLLSIPGR